MPARSRKLFLTDHYLTPFENIPSGGILCENDKIIATGGASAFVHEPELHIYDLNDTYAVPGFIDSHIQGYDDYDITEILKSDNEKMNEISKFLAQHGVTSQPAAERPHALSQCAMVRPVSGTIGHMPVPR